MFRRLVLIFIFVPIASVLIALAVASTLAGASTQASAAGFALIEQSGSGMGNAFAGAAAVAEDASTVFFNPAGMSFLQGPQVSVAAHVINLSAEFSGTATNPAALGGGAAPAVPAAMPAAQRSCRTFTSRCRLASGSALAWASMFPSA